MSLMPNSPLILTATLAARDLTHFDRLRQQHFPPERNYLQAHVTMFHHLPVWHFAEIDRLLCEIAAETRRVIQVEVTEIRHLGAGVAFALASVELEQLRDEVHRHFSPWLTRQDSAKWQPHITVQNKVSKEQADTLYETLSATFSPQVISVTGFDLWRYRGGPWEAAASYPFEPPE